MPLDRNKLRELAKGKASIVSLPASRHKTARATRRAARPAGKKALVEAKYNEKLDLRRGSKFGRRVQDGVLDAQPSRSPHGSRLVCAYFHSIGRAEQRLLGFGCAARADRGYFQATSKPAPKPTHTCTRT